MQDGSFETKWPQRERLKVWKLESLHRLFGVSVWLERGEQGERGTLKVYRLIVLYKKFRGWQIEKPRKQCGEIKENKVKPFETCSFTV